MPKRQGPLGWKLEQTEFSFSTDLVKPRVVLDVSIKIRLMGPWSTLICFQLLHLEFPPRLRSGLTQTRASCWTDRQAASSHCGSHSGLENHGLQGFGLGRKQQLLPFQLVLIVSAWALGSDSSGASKDQFRLALPTCLWSSSDSSSLVFLRSTQDRNDQHVPGPIRHVRGIFTCGKLFIQTPESQGLSALINNICKQPDDCHKCPIYWTIRTKNSQPNT